MRLRTQRFDHVPDSAPTPDWQEGETLLGLYEVRNLLGEGGMGKVYRVHHTGWNVDLAVKSPHGNLLSNPANRAAFIREAETWVNLGLHPNIVSCYYVRSIDNVPRLFAECIDGGSLRDWIQARKITTVKVMLDVAIQFAWGLHYAHESGVIHQDVKPANVMLTTDGVVKVTDFGLAKAREASGEAVPALVTKQAATRPGAPAKISSDKRMNSILVSAGGRTPAYCSPEQANGAALSRRTDIWSWGLSILEMFVGEVTWLAGQAAPMALAGYLEHGSEDASIPRMPVGLAQVLRECFALDPDDRPHTMGLITERLIELYREIVFADYPRPLPDKVQATAAELNNRALSFTDLGKHAEAIRHFDRALVADPHHMEANYNRGLLLWRAGTITDEEVILPLEEVRTSHKSVWLDDYLLGLIHLERSDAASALDCFTEAKRLSRDAPEVERALTLATAGEAKWGQLRWMTTPTGQAVCDLALHPDGLRALSVGMDKQLRMWDMANGAPLGSIDAHLDTVRAVCIPPAGAVAVTASWDKTIKVWALDSARCLRTMTHEPNRLNSIAMSADGQTIFSAGWSNSHHPDRYQVLVWDTNTGQCRQRLDAHEYPIMSISISQDGRRAAAAGNDGTIVILDLATSRATIRIATTFADIAACHLTPDGRHVIATSPDGALICLIADSGKPRWRLRAGQVELSALAITPDSQSLIAATGEALGTAQERYILHEWRVDNGRRVRTLGRSDSTQHHAAPVTALALSDDGRTLLAGDQQGVISLRDINGSSYRAEFTLAAITSAEDAMISQRRVTSFIQSGEAHRHAARNSEAYRDVRNAQQVPGFERDTRLLDMVWLLAQQGRRQSFRNGFCQAIFSDHVKSVGALHLPKGASMFVTGGADNTIRRWDLTTRTGEKTVLQTAAPVRAVCWHPDVDGVFWGTDSEVAFQAWGNQPPQTKTIFRDQNDPRSGVTAMELTVDGEHLLVAYAQNAIRRWPLRQAEPAPCLTYRDHGCAVNALALSPDGACVYSGGVDGVLHTWSLAEVQCLRQSTEHRDSITAVAASPDGQYILTGSADHSLVIWDVAGQKKCRRCTGHTASITAVKILPDPRFSISASQDKTLRIWSIHSGECIRILHGHTAGVLALSVDELGRYVVAAGADGTVRVWELSWEWEFPQTESWDLRLPWYFEIFLEVRRGAWDDAAWRELWDDLRRRGFGSVNERNARERLKIMTKEFAQQRSAWIFARHGIQSS